MKAARVSFLIVAGIVGVLLGADDGKPTPTPTYNVRDYGAVGDGKADDTVAIQAAIDAAPAGDVVVVPRGKYRITASLIVPKTLAIVGAMAYAQGVAERGNASYGTSWEWGSVLLHDSQSGAAIEHVPGSYTGLRLENLVLVGKGKAGTETTGVHVAFPAGAVMLAIRGVYLSNFEIGLDLDTVEYSRFDDLHLWSCDVGIRCSGATSANVFTAIQISACGDGVVLGGGKNTFIGGAIQGCSRNGVLITLGEENTFRDIYFENKDASYAIDARKMSDATVIDSCHFGAPGDNIRIQSNWCKVIATKYAQTLDIEGTGAYVIGNWTGKLSTAPGNSVFGADTVRVPQLTVDNPVKDLALAGSLDFGDGRKWTPEGLFLAKDRYWTLDGLYPGGYVKWPNSGGLGPGENESLRYVGWSVDGRGNRRSGFVVPPMRGK